MAIVGIRPFAVGVLAAFAAVCEANASPSTLVGQRWLFGCALSAGLAAYLALPTMLDYTLILKKISDPIVKNFTAAVIDSEAVLRRVSADLRLSDPVFETS
ncbi:hypothetical protein Rhe02_13480 [Rhizocola hellebori]|uniref:Uncharacterized protein n=1 Tax=Rhizocola hellebori TaxID=1392758 RepID=A0A8J3VEF7_9ACTN|nr:hypothetical protein [Rhizocola hellebori]GIH03281.1 hypothetical protein Rhe02_13480 [Rhizocola hellebori]